jgi:hypothetical protein
MEIMVAKPETFTPQGPMIKVQSFAKDTPQGIMP